LREAVEEKVRKRKFREKWFSYKNKKLRNIRIGSSIGSISVFISKEETKVSKHA